MFTWVLFIYLITDKTQNILHSLVEYSVLIKFTLNKLDKIIEIEVIIFANIMK